MKHIFRYLIIALAAVFAAPSVTAGSSNEHVGGPGTRTARELSVLADSAYMQQRYADAVRYYTEALQIDGPNSSLYYNLGNSYYRKGEVGYAIANYERALRLDPSNSDARLNLQFVRSKIDNLPNDDSGYLSHLQNRIVSLMSPNAWAWTAGLLTALFVGLLALYIFSGSVMLRKVGFFGAMVVLFAVMYSYVTSYSAATARNSRNHGIVVVSGANLNTEPRTPRSGSERVIPIPEGAKLQILDSVATPGDTRTPKWYNVKVNNTTRAWIPCPQVEII